jgi:(E)-4-hydroxy-3-methylbut-2-enyl-diphosphate synthase
LSKVINIGGVLIGGDNNVIIQSMTNTDTASVEETIKQINRLKQAGCEIVRLSAYNKDAAKAFYKIKLKVNIPLVADIHFDYKLAILAIENGADKIRINPGNIGELSKVRKIVDAAKSANIPIRVGVNGGSLEKDILKEYGNTAEGLVMSGLNNIKLIEDMGFSDIVVSVKSSSVFKTINANRILSEKTEYPLHIGVTEAGTYENSIIKSSAAFAPLLMEGIGDTIRVSITGDPVSEVYAAKKILNLIGVRKFGVEVISCPTCARTSIDIEKLAREIEEVLKDFDKPLKIAVMGCAVNGPGEAKEADIGVAGGAGEGHIFVKGKKIKKVKEAELISELKKYIIENF